MDATKIICSVKDEGADDLRWIKKFAPVARDSIIRRGQVGKKNGEFQSQWVAFGEYQASLIYYSTLCFVTFTTAAKASGVTKCTSRY